MYQCTIIVRYTVIYNTYTVILSYSCFLYYLAPYFNMVAKNVFLEVTVFVSRFPCLHDNVDRCQVINIHISMVSRQPLRPFNAGFVCSF